MKKIIPVVAGLAFILISCLKGSNKCSYNDSTIVAPASEVTDLQNYINSLGTSATAHPAGFFYRVNTVGTGTSINNLCTNVTVKYKGKLTNGTVFDSTATGYVASFELGQLIPGWQKGIPLISKGGSITLFIPPSLGYGASPVTNSSGVVVIPGNSKLVFDIELVDVIN